MKQILIVKCGAAGDVVRTTPLLHSFDDWAIDWLAVPGTRELLPSHLLRSVLINPSELEPSIVYDLVISLEDEPALLRKVFQRVRYRRLFGATLNGETPAYTPDAAAWFDLGLISTYGLELANKLKLRNRKSYQEIIFEGLGLRFGGEPYLLPEPKDGGDLAGDIAVAPKAGGRWPSKNWGFFDRLIEDLSREYRVNVLPLRNTIQEHMTDIRAHRFLISGDSLPMHLALGLRIPCVAFFTCTNPWEIYPYGLLRKIVAPTLEDFFFTREDVWEATHSIPYEEGLHAVRQHLKEFGITAMSR